MLDLIAVTYRNIWPFKNQTLSLFFEQGKYLIKAPIGSGKSFLFFDGPSYALYKTASRNLLNIQSKAGAIKLLFEINGQTYLIKRLLKKGKSKDSCASQLFELSDSGAEILEKIKSWSILSQGLDIEDLLAQHNIPFTEIPFKNESDLQQQLSQLLPPAEVFSSTVLLLQDAENIFEMQPAQRLEVLKNVFNLLGIEESKEVIKDKRNEVKYQIKAYQDTSRTQEKLTTSLKTLFAHYQTFQSFPMIADMLQPSQEAIAELEQFVEKLGVEQFEVPQELEAFLPQLHRYLLEQQDAFTQLKTQHQLYQDQKQGINSQLLHLQSIIKKNEIRIQQLDSLLSQSNPQHLSQLRQQKLELQTQQNKLEEKSFKSQISTFFSEQQTKLDLQDRSDFSLVSNQQFVQSLIALWTALKKENELIDTQLQNLETQSQTEQQKLQLQLKTLEDKYAFYQQQLQDFDQKIQSFDQATELDAKFECEKIQASCPFIKAINKHHFEQRAKEKQQMIDQQQIIINKIQHEKLEEQIAWLKTQLQNNDFQLPFLQKKELLLWDKKQKEEKIQILKTFFLTIDHKALADAAQSYQALSPQLHKLEQHILEQEKLMENLENYQQEKTRLQAENTTQQEQIQNLITQQTTIDAQLQTLEQKIHNFPQSDQQKLASAFENYKTTLQSLKTLIEEHKTLQLKIKQLLHEEKLLNNLYTILNKELLLFVLSEFLPILSEIINSYLVNVVDYQIQIRLQESSEKLELETKILDEKGERDIKSLSGGQRAILKLVRMLAISSYMKTKLLFLDETINNLDNDTVAKVADLLNDFVKQRTLKFYTITHNSEIQSMNIWDQTILVPTDKS